MNETDLLGSGGFGSCLWAQDLTTEKMFAIKQNKNVSFKSIEDECHVLSRLADNDYIIKFLGAVIDEGELPTQPPLVCKMMMEPAESRSLLIITTQRPVESQCTVFSPRLIQSMVGGRGLGVACGHIKAFGLFPFPHQTNVCSEGLQGRHALSMLGRTLVYL